jgi:predicted nucleic acid-binding protein
VNAVDSSVVVAAFSSWHLAHAEAAQIIRGAPTLPAHAGLEAYSVLTRMPEPNRASPLLVDAFLSRAFAGRWLTLDGRAVAELVRELAQLGIAGGPTYDALIGATARAAGATLYTCDVRARRTYELLGVEVALVG